MIFRPVPERLGQALGRRTNDCCYPTIDAAARTFRIPRVGSALQPTVATARCVVGGKNSPRYAARRRRSAASLWKNVNST
jgi:hypothetical protein